MNLHQLEYLTALSILLGCATPATAQRGYPPATRTDFYNTPCTINAIASWCAVGQVSGQFASLRVEFAHGDQPILEFVPTSSTPDQWGAIQMREDVSGQLWNRRDGGYTSLIEQGGFANTICLGPGSRLPYPKGCAQP